ncbi:MAG: cation:proton antiporter subunit C [Pseudomonadota bacterium]
MFEFILERYNYWIVIALMMTGLYIVFSRGNLVKTLIGLNLFQTSVFIFYITVGKVVGGTAPILLGGHGDEGHGDAHSPGHGGAHGEGHGETHHDAALSAQDAVAAVHGDLVNQVSPGAGGEIVSEGHTSLHHGPQGVSSNSLYTGSSADEAPNLITREGSIDLSTAAHGHGAEAALDTLYSNPLPHVLILTAIVVGVATTAVGLSLAVRIREAYGTVEEDDIEAIDNKTLLAEVPA